MAASILPSARRDASFVLKWAASIAQIFAYTATAFGWTPLNIHLFLIGLVGWFLVGVMWRDRAIMLIHVIALSAMVAGIISGQKKAPVFLETREQKGRPAPEP